MTLREYAELGQAMRNAQKAYFRTPVTDSAKAERLSQSKALERQYDAATADILNPKNVTPNLFDQPPEEPA